MDFRTKVLAVFAGLALLGGAARADGIHEGGGGGNQPDPLGVFNRHFELADGEMYLLVGNIVFIPPREGRGLRPHLEVDFSEQSWLGSKGRRKSPFYEIEGPAADWKVWEGTPVRLAVRARARWVSHSRAEPGLSIVLKVMDELSSVPYFNRGRCEADSPAP